MYNKTLFSATAAVCALVATHATMAATPPPGNSSSVAELEEIVVTAQFRKQTLQSTPLAITAVNSAMLDARGQTNVTAIAAQAPNVTLTPSGQTGGSSMIAVIRGVGQQDSSYALEPGVGIYVDDVYYASLTGTMMDLLDVDRIEVLRGPQGTLAGKNSIGGAVKVYSKQPEASGGYIQATVGSDSRLDFKGSTNFTLADNLFMNLAGLTRNQDGYVDRIDYACANPGSGLPPSSTNASCKLGTEGGKNVAAGRLGLRWLASDALSVNFSADYTRDKSEETPNVIADFEFPSFTPGYDRRFIGPKYVSYSTYLDSRAPDAAHPWQPAAFPAINHLNAWGGSFVVDWTLSDKTSFKSITAYRNYFNDYGGDQSSPIPVVLANVVQRLNQVSQEFRLNSSIGDVVDYTVGAYYLRVHASQKGRTDLPYLLDIPGDPRLPPQAPIDLDFLENNTIKSSSVAGFFQATAHLTDKFDLIGGYRLTRDKKDYLYGRSNPDGSPIQPPNIGVAALPPFPGPVFYVLPGSPPNWPLFGLDGVTNNYSKTRSDFRLNGTYNWSSDLMTYLQVATGYKGGGVNPRANDAAQAVSFDPEYMTAYEAGLKSSFMDRRVILNVAAFYNNYKDIQLTVSSCPDLSPGPCQAPRNMGDAHVKGLEVETTLLPTDGLMIDASVSYLDFKYTRINPPAAPVPPSPPVPPSLTSPGSLGSPGSPGVTLDDTSPYTPKYKASLGLQYDIAVGLGTVTPRLDAAYRSKMQTRLYESSFTELPGLTLLNARLTYKPNAGSWQTSLEVTNLTNKYYFLNKIGISGLGAITGAPGEPRRWALSFRNNF